MGACTSGTADHVRCLSSVTTRNLPVPVAGCRSAHCRALQSVCTFWPACAMKALIALQWWHQEVDAVIAGQVRRLGTTCRACGDFGQRRTFAVQCPAQDACILLVWLLCMTCDVARWTEPFTNPSCLRTTPAPNGQFSFHRFTNFMPLKRCGRDGGWSASTPRRVLV